jgi:hypothetical protein
VGSAFSLEVRASEAGLIVPLEERDDSGVSGEVVLMRQDGLTVATVTIIDGVGPYLPYLRRGSCTSFRENPAIPLALASAGAPSTTTIDLPLDELSGAYVIALYAVEGNLDALLDATNSLACGRIVTAADDAVPVTPPTAGIGLAGVNGGSVASLAIGCAALAGVFGLLGVRQQRRATVAARHAVHAETQRWQGYQ